MGMFSRYSDVGGLVVKEQMKRLMYVAPFEVKLLIVPCCAFHPKWV